jgi:hypothetical protein
MLPLPAYNEIMMKFVYLLLILGFVFVDFLFFHDVFKLGESTSVAQYLTGILSIPVFVISVRSLVSK